MVTNADAIPSGVNAGPGANPNKSQAISEIVPVPSPKEIVLDEIPNALVHTDR